MTSKRVFVPTALPPSRLEWMQQQLQKKQKKNTHRTNNIDSMTLNGLAVGGTSAIRNIHSTGEHMKPSVLNFAFTKRRNKFVVPFFFSALSLYAFAKESNRNINRKKKKQKKNCSLRTSWPVIWWLAKSKITVAFEKVSRTIQISPKEINLHPLCSMMGGIEWTVTKERKMLDEANTQRA